MKYMMVSPEESEAAVRGRSQKFYTDTLAHFVTQHFGVEYGLRHAEDSTLAG